MLDELIVKIVDWQKISELLCVYIKKEDEIKNASENQIQNINSTTFIFGDAIHDIYNNESEGIDFSRIPGIIKAYRDNKNKFWYDLLVKYTREKSNYPISNIRDVISHFYAVLYVCDTQES